MIYFCNTFITETKPKIGKGYLDRGNLRKFTNFDIFKYSLASVSKIYKVGTEYIIMTENSIYIVDVNIASKRISA